MEDGRISCRRLRGCAMLWRGFGLLAVPLALLPMPALADDSAGHPGWRRSGDLLQWALPLTGLVLVLVDPPSTGAGTLDDAPASASGLNWPGPRLAGAPLRQFGVAFLRMELTTYSLKYAIDAPRPNGGHQGFPSGHTASAFMGAEFIRKEYGWAAGVPAYLTAGWVGYTRIDAREHYWRDVIAGAAIGIAANHDFDTHVGGSLLSIAPAMLQPGGGPDEDKQAPASPGEPVAPGISVGLRF